MRKSASRFVVMFETGGTTSDAISNFLKLEGELIRMYMDEMRKFGSDSSFRRHGETGKRESTNGITGTKLTLDEAIQHLYQFCATLPAAPYVDLRPSFTFDHHPSSGRAKSVSTKVILPISVDISLREAQGMSTLETEKMARRDAVFQAYAALYRAGLVNDNFLPVGHVNRRVDEAYTAVEKRPSLIEVSEQWNPWYFVAQVWQKSRNLATATISIKERGRHITEMLIFLPYPLPTFHDFELYWDTSTTYQAVIEKSSATHVPELREAAAEITYLLHRSRYIGRMTDDRRDFVALVIPPNVDDLLTWVKERSGTVPAQNILGLDIHENKVGLIRHLADNERLHIFHDVRYTAHEDFLNNDSMDIDHVENPRSKRHPLPDRGSLMAEDPDFFSDIIESLLGAIYIDTHSSLPVCERFLEKIGLMLYLRRVMHDHVAILHPKEEVGQLSNQETIKYVIGKEDDEGSVRLTCSVMLDDREVVQVGNGLSLVDVQTRAAHECCVILRAEGRRLRHNMGYSNQDADGNEDAVGITENTNIKEAQDPSLAGRTILGYDSDEYVTADKRYALRKIQPLDFMW